MKAGGCSFDEVYVTTSEVFEALQPGLALPEFAWLKISGTAGEDDFGMSSDNRLVVSEAVWKVLASFSVTYCDVSTYPPTTSAAGDGPRC